jgi:hypothetical protein
MNTVSNFQGVSNVLMVFFIHLWWVFFGTLLTYVKKRRCVDY